MIKTGEWLASMLVMFGVIGISFGVAHDHVWIVGVGCVLLTFGVRLAIDMGRTDG